MIEVKNLTKSLPNGKRLLDRISFCVNKGEFVGILGPSGAGKTLTIRCLNGLLKPDYGSVIVRDENNVAHDICQVDKRNLRKLRQKIGVIFQGFHLVQRLSAIENVMIGRLGQINSLRSLFYGFTDKEAEEAMGALEKVKISHMAAAKVGSMSGGERQRVAIARAIFQNPTLLLADEPISNLDPSNAKSIMKLIRPLSLDIPVVGVFHQPEMTAKYCTRVIAIKEGRIIYDGDPQLSTDKLIEIYGEELRQIEMQAGKVLENVAGTKEIAPLVGNEITASGITSSMLTPNVRNATAGVNPIDFRNSIFFNKARPGENDVKQSSGDEENQRIETKVTTVKEGAL